MKKIITLMLVAMFFCAKAQTNRTATTSATGTFGGEVSIPVIVTAKFKQDHPNVVETWSNAEDNFAAQYRDQATNLTNIVVYDRFGNLVQTDVELEPSANPKAVCSYYSKHFPEEKYVIWKSIDAKGKVTYYSKREYIIICFDKKGKFISTKDNKEAKEKKATQLTEKSK